jgi:hypothetical protein
VRASAAPPVISVWYRGVPAGVPRSQDLQMIHAIGFTAITWPALQIDHVGELRDMASAAGLLVIVRPEGARPAVLVSGTLPERVDLSVSSLAPAEIGLVVWRAIAHGARTISLDADARDAAGIWSQSGAINVWVEPALAVADQITRQAALIDSMRAVPAIVFDEQPTTGLDIVLLETPRSWVVVTTNRSSSRGAARVHLPADVPPAEWMNLMTSKVLAMIAKPDGPRWTCDLAPGQVQVLVIDKRPHASIVPATTAR